MAELGATNAEIIAEFRANRGKVGRFFRNDALLLLTTTGRKTGKEHTIPLSYIEDDAQLVLIGANLASSRVSDWFHNITANSTVIVEVDDGRYCGHAAVVEGDRRDRILDRMRVSWDASRRDHPNLTELPVRTDGSIPVVALKLVGDSSHSRNDEE
jgi:deazaflavin-dependent oxidoreductase (nitroreductase family)